MDCMPLDDSSARKTCRLSGRESLGFQRRRIRRIARRHMERVGQPPLKGAEIHL